MNRQQNNKAPGRSRLWAHLGIVLIVKIILLTLLWHAFIKPNKVKVDIDTMSSRIAGGSTPASGATPPSLSTSPGDNR